MRTAHKTRRAGRASPVLIAVPHPAADGIKVSICGPAGDAPPVFADLDPAHVERICRLALNEPTHHAAARFLASALPELDAPLPGLRNVGLLATHELAAGVPQRGDWADAVRRSAPLLEAQGPQLVKRLGFGVQPSGASASLLTINGTGRVVAVFCDASEPFDAAAQRFDGSSPVSHALAVADRHKVDWAMLTRGSEIRLYAARPDTGVGRKGRAETFVEVNLALLDQQRAGYLYLLFSADALDEDGIIEEILGSSTRFAADLATRLRDRVYFETVPALAAAAAKRIAPEPTRDELAAAYEQVMVILFRLLFVAYAEDKDLLPYRSNSLYEARSLKRLAIDTAHQHKTGTPPSYSSTSTALWDQVKELWAAVSRGRPRWGVPAYNGGLFAEDPSVSSAGAALADLRLTDDEFGPALESLLIVDGGDGLGPVDFRSLSVREFGTIYEGLLESRLAVATNDLTVKAGAKGEQYVPAGARDRVHVQADEVYLEGVSGQRKATGSYFTKSFCVEHLLDEALEPALQAHLAQLTELHSAGDEAAAAEAFFDFRCADIAMGSGHFLVAALDRIEAALSGWLADHPLPQITAELERLRSAAFAALGDLAAGVEIESSSLLRRQVARRCMYGVDLNPIAVELARLALWVHTFVPGLPLSFLDHNLVCGDSLTGVGTINEALKALGSDEGSLFAGQVHDLLAGASDALSRLARTSDADAAEISEARAAHRAAQQAVKGATAIFDVITAARAGACTLPERLDESTFMQTAVQSKAVAAATELRPVHFPAVFPEVFLRGHPGFDCCLGNPPFEQLVVQKHEWWGMHLPRGVGKSVAKMNAEIDTLRRLRPDLEAAYQAAERQADRMRGVLRAAFPELGAGRTDLYKAFAWRNWRLARQGGSAGIVLPRAALQTKGSEQWRKTVLQEGTFHSAVTLSNAGGWVFDDVHGQFVVALLALRRTTEPERNLTCSGPFRDRLAFEKHRAAKPMSVTAVEFFSWSDDVSFPQLPADDSALRVFRKLRMHPRLDGRSVGRSDGRTDHPPASPVSQMESNPSRGTARHSRQAPLRARRRRVRPIQGDINATNDKHRLVLDAGRSARSVSSTPQQTSTASSSTPGTPQ